MLSEWVGFKLVGDNIDKTVKPRYMRVDRQTKSLHYFNVYAVKDRVNLSSLSDQKPTSVPPISEAIPRLFPTAKDHTALQQNFVIHIARILADYIPFFSFGFADVVDKHIKHEYSKEMAQKSQVVCITLHVLMTCQLYSLHCTQVPLGIQLKNELKHEDMVSIMDSLHDYVPTTCHEEERRISTGDSVTSQKHSFHRVILGRDQLTTARAQGSQKIRMNSDTALDRLEGLLPVTEDWHTRLCLLVVSITYEALLY